MIELIDRLKLIEDFRNTITENPDTFDWLYMIQRRPIAYDLVKAIEELRKRENKYCDRSLLEEQRGNDKQASYYGGKSDAFSESVIIINHILNKDGSD